MDEMVHPFALLEKKGNVRRALFEALLELEHGKGLGKLLEDVVELRLDARRRGELCVPLSAAALLQLGDGVEERVSLRCHKVDLRVRVTAVGRGSLVFHVLANVLEVLLIGKVLRRGEAWIELEPLEELQKKQMEASDDSEKNTGRDVWEKWRADGRLACSLTYVFRKVAQRRRSQWAVMCPPYMISPKR